MYAGNEDSKLEFSAFSELNPSKDDDTFVYYGRTSPSHFRPHNESYKSVVHRAAIRRPIIRGSNYSSKPIYQKTEHPEKNSNSGYGAFYKRDDHDRYFIIFP